MAFLLDMIGCGPDDPHAHAASRGGGAIAALGGGGEEAPPPVPRSPKSLGPEEREKDGVVPLSPRTDVDADSNSADAEFELLRSRLREAEEGRARAEARLAQALYRDDMWTEATRRILFPLILGPHMCSLYRRELVKALGRALNNSGFIEGSAVHPSFPTVPSEAPVLSLRHFNSLNDTAWDVMWSPRSWSVDAAIEGSVAGGFGAFSIGVHVSGLSVEGTLLARASAGLESIWLSFDEEPNVGLSVVSNVTWGVVPLPLKARIESLVLGELRNFLKNFMQRPKELEVKLLGRNKNKDKDSANGNGNGNGNTSSSDNNNAAPAPASTSNMTDGEMQPPSDDQENDLSIVDEGFVSPVKGTNPPPSEFDEDAASPPPQMRTNALTDDEVAQAEAAALAAKMFDMSPLTAARRTSSRT